MDDPFTCCATDIDEREEEAESRSRWANEDDDGAVREQATRYDRESRGTTEADVDVTAPRTGVVVDDTRD